MDIRRLCLRDYLHMRAVAIAVAGLTLAYTHVALGMDVPLLPLASVLTVLGLFTVHTWRRIRGVTPATDRHLLVQLLVDVGALGALLFFTGGSGNPLVLLFLLPVTVAAASLPPRSTWAVVTVAALVYTVLMFVHLPLADHGAGEHAFRVHVWGMWLAFLLGAGLVGYYVARIGARLRHHEQQVAEAREREMHADRMLALGTLAAGTAHELGTPLATMAVLSKELEHEFSEEPEVRDRLRTLRGEVARCKSILARMASDAGQRQAESGHRVQLDRYLDGLVDQWRGERPGVSVTANWSGPRPAPEIIADRTLGQALLNVLNNAADACADSVTVEADWTPDVLHLEVRDRGAGVPEHLSGRLGQPFVSGKETGEGLGLGLFLARTTLQRLGGRLVLANRPETGACASIELPLGAISAGSGSRGAT